MANKTNIFALYLLFVETATYSDIFEQIALLTL